MTDAERAAALDAIAEEVARCTRCRLHEGRTRAVPGEGSPDTEVVLIGEGPGFNEDRQGRPFVGRAGQTLVRLLGMIGWRREDVFITNVVKCRPPENRDPEPDEIAACAPFLTRQLQVLDPALIVTLGRHSMGRYMPGSKISQVHGTYRPVDPASAASAALVYALYHPAAADRSPDVMRQSERDVLGIPGALLESRRRREQGEAARPATPADEAAVSGASGPAGEPTAPTAESETRATELALPANRPAAPAQATPAAALTSEPAPEPEATATSSPMPDLVPPAAEANAVLPRPAEPAPTPRPSVRPAPGEDDAAAPAAPPAPDGEPAPSAGQLPLF